VEREDTKAIIESLIFASDSPLTIDKVKEVMEEMSKEELKELVGELIEEYQNHKRGIFIREVAYGYQFCTKPEQAQWIQKLRRTKPYHLSQPTMETLAIIAYKQPLTRVEVEEVRGVDCAGILQSLLEKKLVTILGRKDVVGRPFLYGTTPKFLEVFGLENLASLPTLQEIEQLKDSNFPLFKQDTE
jgi:segregation and condensation protein B